jgi:hypothetical protein
VPPQWAAAEIERSRFAFNAAATELTWSILKLIKVIRQGLLPDGRRTKEILLAAHFDSSSVAELVRHMVGCRFSRGTQPAVGASQSKLGVC